MFQQITGINTVIYFAPTIFQSAGLPSAATSILATAGVGAVNVIMTIVSIRLIDRLGRRQLLFWSLGGMAVTLLILSGAFYGGTSGQLAWIAVVSVAAFVGFFAIGLGPVFWLLIAEIFPLAVRGRAMSLATVCQLGLQPDRLGDFPQSGRRCRQCGCFPGLRRAEPGGAGIRRAGWCRRRKDAASNRSRQRWTPASSEPSMKADAVSPHRDGPPFGALPVCPAASVARTHPRSETPAYTPPGVEHLLGDL